MEPRNPELEAALRDNPDDVASALVYADWLAQHGHPRGALIAIQAALRDRPDDPALIADEERLRAPLEVTAFRGDVTWSLGFVRTARVYGQLDPDIPEMVDALLDHPSARLLRELAVWTSRNGTAIVRRICTADPAPPLRALELPLEDDTELTGLAARYPGLRSLELDTVFGHTEVDELAGLTLERFAYRTRSLRRRVLDTIAAMQWPELVDLELEFDELASDDYAIAAECHMSQLAPLFEATSAPKLRILRLASHAGFRPDELPLLFESRLLAQLEVLQLSGGVDPEAIRRAAPRLRHLRALRLYATDAAPLAGSGLPIETMPA